MDLSKLSTEDLLALKGGDLSKVSTEGLQALKQQSIHAAAAADTAKFEATLDPTQGMSMADKVYAGVGKAFSDVGLGVKQRLGLASRDDVVDSRRLDAPLMKNGSAVAGNLIGNLSMLAPTALIPGAATVPGAAALNGAIGFMQPSASLKEDAMNTALGAAGGAGGQYVANMAGSAAAAQAARNATNTAQNAQKTQAAQRASAAGYVIPPEDLANPSLTTRVLQGVGGKIKTAQEASQRNQGVTNALAKREIGLAETDALTPKVLQTIREKAGQAYDVVKGSGTVTADQAFITDLDKIAQQYGNAAKAFPGAVKSEIPDLVAALKQPSFSADGAVDMTKVLRKSADKAFASGDTELGKASKQAADAIEGMLERHLQAQAAPLRPALLLKDGTVVAGEPGRTHLSIMANAPGNLSGKVQDSGFVNGAGKYLTRDEAEAVANIGHGPLDAADYARNGNLNPANALKAFQEARQLIAKTYSVQKGLNGTTGDVSANALAKQLDKGKPLSGNLLTIAEAGQSFPKATQALKEAPKSLSPLDMALAVIQRDPMALATLGARPAARSVMLSQPAQQAALRSAATPRPANMLLQGLSQEQLTLPASFAGSNALAAYLAQQQ